MSDDESNHGREATTTGIDGQADESRRRYRLTVHRIAHARLRDELESGMSGTLATWVALRETTAHCSLSQSESAHLLTSLQAAAQDTDLRR
jgi:hypothetical protein